MPEFAIKVHVPSLLHACTQEQPTVEVRAATLSGCLDALQHDYPQLRVHLFDQQGQQRPHVLFFLNGENTRWLADADHPLSEGDELTILQAVSGG